MNKTKSQTSEFIYEMKPKNSQPLFLEITTSSITIDKMKYNLISCRDMTYEKLADNHINEAILRTQEEERYEIGAELHDNVCQVLATSQIYLSILKTKTQNHDSGSTLDNINDLIQKSLNEIRNISHQLAPPFFEDSTLQETLPILFENFNYASEAVLEVNFDESVNQLFIKKDTHLAIFRILQEQLRNIQKYANAKNVSIDIRKSNDNICVAIKDNGIGFNRKSKKKGIGLTNIERRVEILKGRIEIFSKLNQGCSLKIELPQ